MGRLNQGANALRYKEAPEALPTDAAGLKALLVQTISDFKALKAEKEETLANVKSQLGELETGLAKNKDFITGEALEEKLNELSDQMAKIKPVTQALPEDGVKALRAVAVKTWGSFVGQKREDGIVDGFKAFVSGNEATEQFKTLNITNPEDGGLAVAEVLSQDLIEYGREYSPILSNVGRKTSMTRNFRELVLVGYPSVAKGIENVAGTNFAETDTQEYKEVKSKEFKVYAKPRITDEARYGADRDIYGDLVRLIGDEIGIYLAAQVLYGDGGDKNARGILSVRIDITNLTGESFKPTLAADPADARGVDFYPVTATNVDGALGTDDKAIVDLTIDVVSLQPTRFLNGSAWYMNRKTRAVLAKVRDAEDRPIFQTEYRDNVATVVIQGYPVIIDDTMPDIASASTPIIFGQLNRAYVIAPGDINYMLMDPYTVDACTVLKYHLEMFEMIQNSDAIQVIACTTNGPA